jgi:segregation and condensation protein A
MYNVKLEIFEGPFDLLLHLIKLNEVDIYDIPIGIITTQYLEYIDLMKELDIEIAGDFLIISAELLKIKSSMLLPMDEEQQEEVEELKRNLIDRIVEYKKFKELSVKLHILAEEQLDYYKKEPIVNKEFSSGLVNFIEVDLYSLLSSYKIILKKVEKRKVPIIEGEEFTIQDKMNYISDLIKLKNSIKFSDIFESVRNRVEVIITFIALLELIKLHKITAHQTDMFQEIYIRKV